MCFLLLGPPAATVALHVYACTTACHIKQSAARGRAGHDRHAQGLQMPRKAEVRASKVPVHTLSRLLRFCPPEVAFHRKYLGPLFGVQNPCTSSYTACGAARLPY